MHDMMNGSPVRTSDVPIPVLASAARSMVTVVSNSGRRSGSSTEDGGGAGSKPVWGRTWGVCPPSLFFFFQNTQYIGDTHNARTLIPMETVPANPQDWQSHHRRLAVNGNVAYHWKHKHR
jgi:hypothetical protein